MADAVFKTCTLIFLFSLSFGGSCETIDPKRSLLITDLRVVNSKQMLVSWNFNQLLRRVSRLKKNNQETLSQWLNEWRVVTSVNEKPVTTLDPKQLLFFWPLRNNRVDLESSPFIVSAVSYRPDLADAHSGGELRIIYSGFDGVKQLPLQLTVIAEFSIPKNRESQVKHQFRRLSSVPFGDEFNETLDRIFTELFVPENFSQLRVNDFVMNSVWDLREFHLVGGSLLMSPTAATPASPRTADEETDLISEVEAHEEQILKGEYRLPNRFLGGMALVPTEQFQWLKDSRLRPEVQNSFSLMTCNGCHSGTTQTRFVHVEPRAIDEEAKLSEYLKLQLEDRKKYFQGFKQRKHPFVH